MKWKRLRHLDTYQFYHCDYFVTFIWDPTESYEYCKCIILFFRRFFQKTIFGCINVCGLKKIISAIWCLNSFRGYYYSWLSVHHENSENKYTAKFNTFAVLFLHNGTRTGSVLESIFMFCMLCVERIENMLKQQVQFFTCKLIIDKTGAVTIMCPNLILPFHITIFFPNTGVFWLTSEYRGRTTMCIIFTEFKKCMFLFYFLHLSLAICFKNSEVD